VLILTYVSPPLFADFAPVVRRLIYYANTIGHVCMLLPFVVTQAHVGLGSIPQQPAGTFCLFDATSVCSGVHAPEMTNLTIHDAYRWLRAQVLVPFHVCDAGGRLTRCIKTTDSAWLLPDGDGQSNPSLPARWSVRGAGGAALRQ
jgi:hypothetical protein